MSGSYTHLEKVLEEFKKFEEFQEEFPLESRLKKAFPNINIDTIVLNDELVEIVVESIESSCAICFQTETKNSPRANREIFTKIKKYFFNQPIS